MSSCVCRAAPPLSVPCPMLRRSVLHRVGKHLFDDRRAARSSLVVAAAHRIMRNTRPLWSIMRQQHVTGRPHMLVGEGVMHTPLFPRERGQCYGPVDCAAAPAPAGGFVSGSARNLPMICGTSGDVLKL